MIPFLPRFPHRWLLRLAIIFFLSMVCNLWQGPAFSQPISQSPTLQQTAPDTTTLRANSRGAQVRRLQSRLRRLGYLEGSPSRVYDIPTQLAVEEFQQDWELTVDGIAGPMTQRMILEAQNEDITKSVIRSRQTDNPSTIESQSANAIEESSAEASPTEESSTYAENRSEISPDIQRILERDKLVVAMLETDNPPFFNSSSDDEPTGLDIKISQGIANSLGVALEFNRSAKTFNEVVDQVYQLKADLAVSKLSQTMTRAKRVRFSHPYVTMRQGLLVNRLQLAQQNEGNQLIKSIRNFSGDVGVIKGSSYVGFIRQKFPQANIKEYSEWSEVVDAVIEGEVQIAYRDELEVKKEILKNPDDALRLQTIALTDTKDRIAIALPWDSSNLQAFVNQYLDTFNLDYTADLVLEEYASY